MTPFEVSLKGYKMKRHLIEFFAQQEKNTLNISEGHENAV